MLPLSKPSLAAWGLFFRSYIHLSLNCLPFLLFLFFVLCFVLCVGLLLTTYHLADGMRGEERRGTTYLCCFLYVNILTL